MAPTLWYSKNISITAYMMNINKSLKHVDPRCSAISLLRCCLVLWHPENPVESDKSYGDLLLGHCFFSGKLLARFCDTLTRVYDNGLSY